jgi:ABC-type phosphate transport system substrate-binding protein
VGLDLAEETTKKRQATAGDEFSIPVVAHAIGVGYNLPQLQMMAPLALNLSTLADIYLGTVDTWDHPAIRELNPDLQGLLPAQPITVALPNSDDKATRILIQTLSAASQTFRDQVHASTQRTRRTHRTRINPKRSQVGTSGHFPVADTGRAVVVDDVTTPLQATSYTLAVASQEPIRTLRYLGFADLINLQNVRLTATSASISSAINDYRARPFTSYLVNGALGSSLIVVCVCVCVFVCSCVRAFVRWCVC